MSSQYTDVNIQALRCEYLTNPLGIDESEPRLSWVLSSNMRGQRQTAFQILVSSDLKELADNHGDLWDSGKVASTQSAHIAYEGKSLQSQQRCWWKVRVWDMNGHLSAYSEPAWWEIGLLKPEDWRSSWIGSSVIELPDLQPSPYLRTTFAVKRAVRQARIYVTAKGIYELRLNGGRVGEAVLSPGWTDYDRRIQYQTYDVKPHILSGENAIGAIPNPMVNQLQQNILWGQRGNFLSVPTDCPQRNERLGWLGDAQVFVRTACCNMDVAAFYTKWMIDIEDAQSPNGAFSCVAPRLARLEDGCPAWGDGGVIIPWTIYRVYGDRRIIERHWDAMVRWMDYLLQASPGLLWVGRLTRNYGDWLSINADTPKEVLGTAYFAYDASLMTEMAAAIGRHDEAEKYQRLFEGIKEVFIRAYVAEDGRIRGDTQTVYALALHMNLLPENLRAAAAAHLVEDIATRNGHLSTGFVGVSYLCPVLSENGYADMALQLLTNETFPSWGYSIKSGATTIWERWDGWTEEKGFQDKQMNSFNHYALGSIGQWLFQSLAGIDLVSPGFEHILIRPRIGGGFTHVACEYESIRGKIVSKWHVADDILELSVTIPMNTTATLYMPTINEDSIKEGDAPIAEVEGIQFVRREANCAVYAIAAGSYVFTTKFTT